MSVSRVVHLTPALFGASGVFGGGERYAFELARHMARVVPTSLVTFADRADRCATPDGLEVVSLGPSLRVRGQEANRLSYGLARAVADADVIHCHQPHTLAAELVAVLGRLRGSTVVATDLGGGGWGFSSFLRTDRWFHRHLHLSEYSRQLAGQSADPRAAVILGGVDTVAFRPDPERSREPTVLFVGRLMPHKGVHDLVAAVPEGLSLELIGQPYDACFTAGLRRLAAGRPVRFRHDCDDAEVVRAYQRALCVVLPSVYRSSYGTETRVPELLGLALLEAMACGAVVIGTDVASLPEVVADGETGFVVPPNDPLALRAKLEWLRDHPAEAARMGRAGRQRVEAQFTWPAVVERCLATYRKDAGEP